MPIDVKNSVVLITSTDPDNHKFGSGFVIHKEGPVVYLVTCAHVIRDVGGKGQLKVGKYNGKMIASGSEEDPADLALITIEVGSAGPENEITDSDPSSYERVLKAPSLRLGCYARIGGLLTVTGFRRLKKRYEVGSIPGRLYKEVGHETRGKGARISVWGLKIIGEDKLKGGYSGSPVIDEDSGGVLGVVSMRFGEGEKGRAISIHMLNFLLDELPPELHSLKKLIQKLDMFIHKLSGHEGKGHAENCKYLPYLADRKVQKKILFKKIENSLLQPRVSPIVGLIHGDASQGHEKFFKCLEEHYWQDLKGVRPEHPGLKLVPLAWPESYRNFDDLEYQILADLQALVGSRIEKNFDDISYAINRKFDQPILFHTYIDTKDWQKMGEKTIDDFIRFWRKWPKRKPGKIVVACLNIQYRKSKKKKNIFDGIKQILNLESSAKAINKQIRKALASVELENDRDIEVCLIPEFEGIFIRHAEDWSRLSVVREFTGEYDFIPYIRTLYESEEMLPMDSFAENMREKLEDILISRR